MNKTEAKKKIEEYFSGTELGSEKTKKMKKLAMKYRIRLGEYRRRFCQKCYADLKGGKVRVGKNRKTILCSCGYLNKVKL